MNFENEVMTANTGGNYTLAPAGNHVARCCRVIELGTIQNNFTDPTGKVHEKRDKMLRVEFELVNTSHVFHEENGPEPFVVEVEWLYSMHKKANMRKSLQSWQGEPMSEAEAKAFNIVRLLGPADGEGAECLINIIHTESKSGNKYATIAAIAQIPDGTMVPKGKNPRLLFNFNPPFKTEQFNSLNKFVQDKIKSSDEYIKLASEHASGATEPVIATQAQAITGTTANADTAQAAPVKKKLPF